MATDKKKFKESAKSKASRLDPKVAKKRKSYVKKQTKANEAYSKFQKTGKGYGKAKRTATRAGKASNKLIKTVGKQAKKYTK